MNGYYTVPVLLYQTSIATRVGHKISPHEIWRNIGKISHFCEISAKYLYREILLHILVHYVIPLNTLN
jgi:hypothetical protein